MPLSIWGCGHEIGGTHVPGCANLDVLCGRHARSMVVPGLAAPEGLSDGCGIATTGSGPAA